MEEDSGAIFELLSFEKTSDIISPFRQRERSRDRFLKRHCRNENFCSNLLKLSHNSFRIFRWIFLLVIFACLFLARTYLIYSPILHFGLIIDINLNR